MPVPAFNLYPPFSIVRVSHTELVVRDLAASRAFYVDTLGLQVTFEDSGMICLRAMEERGHHCLILRKGDDPVSRYLAFRVFSEEDLDKAEAHFAGQGRETSWVERPFQGARFGFWTRTAFRWNSISRWSASRPSTRNTRSIAG